MTDNIQCGFCWPLLDPNEEDQRNQIQHECRRDYTHDGDHRCHCGEEASRVHEVLPDAMVWTPNLEA